MAFRVPKEILEKYKNKSLEELFGNTEIVENEFGEFVKITDPFGLDEFGANRIKKEELQLFECILRSKLQLIPGIGEKKNLFLKKRCITDISDLLGLYTKNYYSIKDVMQTINSKDVHKLRNLKKTRDEDFLFCVNPEEIMFFDIETTGQTSSEVFLIGMGYYSNQGKFVTELLFAREIAEEIAILYYFLHKIVGYRMFVTYNGRSFDIPFIQNRISILFEPKDIEEFLLQGIPVCSPVEKSTGIFGLSKQIFDRLIHFDLYHAIRCEFKNQFPNYKLTTAEQYLLDFERIDNLPSAEVPIAYKSFIEDSNLFMGAMYKILEHNFYDVVNLERLLRTWIRKQIEEFYIALYSANSPDVKPYEQILRELNKVRHKLRSFNLDPFFV